VSTLHAMDTKVLPVAREPLTLDAYEALGEEWRVEVVDGVPVMSPEPTVRHQRAAARLFRLLDDASGPGWVSVGPVDWMISKVPLTMRAPDVVVVPHRLVVDDAKRLVEAPLLAVEILSPGSYERDLVTKRHQYGAAGLRHYWVVGPDVPEVIAFGYRNGDLVEVARASGDEVLSVDQPFPLTLRPADLLG
jgi:Uma2 family endonuclease